MSVMRQHGISKIIILFYLLIVQSSDIMHSAVKIITESIYRVLRDIIAILLIAQLSLHTAGCFILEERYRLHVLDLISNELFQCSLSFLG